MCRHFKELGDPTAILHHLIFASMTAYVLAHSIMAFPFVWLAFCEVSTPSVNLRCAVPLSPPCLHFILPGRCLKLHSVQGAVLAALCAHAVKPLSFPAQQNEKSKLCKAQCAHGIRTRD